MQRLFRSIVLLGGSFCVAACGGGGQQDQKEQVPDKVEVQASARPASFGLCVTCHSDQKDRNGLGPSLFGVVGRRAGTLDGYTYSPAMKASSMQWDEATIDRFIQDPRDVLPGTKMSLPGIKEPEKRAEIISYLANLK